jgi:hypothetical protein
MGGELLWLFCVGFYGFNGWQEPFLPGALLENREKCEWGSGESWKLAFPCLL